MNGPVRVIARNHEQFIQWCRENGNINPRDPSRVRYIAAAHFLRGISPDAVLIVLGYPEHGGHALMEEVDRFRYLQDVLREVEKVQPRHQDVDFDEIQLLVKERRSRVQRTQELREAM